MTEEQRLRNMQVPKHKIDVVLDTDTYNEIDDQYALGYMLMCEDKLNIKGILAAPYMDWNGVHTPEYGMERSYEEIFHILRLMNREDMASAVYRGSRGYLPDEETPVESEAARFLAELSSQYSPENPLYIIAIGAITNVASAMLMNPDMANNTVVVWLGGTAYHVGHSYEFNLLQDVAAARVVMGSGVPFIHIPCEGVVTEFRTTQYELEYWLKGKNAFCDYLVKHTTEAAEKYAKGTAWSRVIWDVTAVAWLMNDGDRYMLSELRSCPIPQYDHHYSFAKDRPIIRYVNRIKRDELFTDLFTRLAKV